MAGSGKTTLIQRLNSHLHSRKLPGYIINLDPAVGQLPYGANVDIRDTARRARGREVGRDVCGASRRGAGAAGVAAAAGGGGKRGAVPVRAAGRLPVPPNMVRRAPVAHPNLYYS